MSEVQAGWAKKFAGFFAEKKYVFQYEPGCEQDKGYYGTVVAFPSEGYAMAGAAVPPRVAGSEALARVVSSGRPRRYPMEGIESPDSSAVRACMTPRAAPVRLRARRRRSKPGSKRRSKIHTTRSPYWRYHCGSLVPKAMAGMPTCAVIFVLRVVTCPCRYSGNQNRAVTPKPRPARQWREGLGGDLVTL